MTGHPVPWTERILTFGSTQNLVGIHCSHQNGGRSRPVVIFLNSGLVHRVGPNRLYVRMARQLAALGVSSIRFDLGGIGDSASDAEAGSILEQVERDVSKAIDAAGRVDGTGVVLLGICSGADNGFAAAVRDPRVVGAVLVDPNVHLTWSFYLHYIAKRMVRLRTWLNLISGPHSLANRIRARFSKEPEKSEAPANVFLAPTTLPPRDTMRQQLMQLIQRRTRLLYIFTGGLEWRYNHRRQLFRAFPGIDWKALAQLEFYAGSDHTFSRADHQQMLIDRVCHWVESTSFREPAEDSSEAANEAALAL